MKKYVFFRSSLDTSVITYCCMKFYIKMAKCSTFIPTFFIVCVFAKLMSVFSENIQLSMQNGV